MFTVISKILVVTLSVVLLSGCGKSKKSKQLGVGDTSQAQGAPQETAPPVTTPEPAVGTSSTLVVSSTEVIVNNSEPRIDGEENLSSSGAQTGADSTDDNGQTASGRDRRRNSTPNISSGAPSAQPATPQARPAAPVVSSVPASPVAVPAAPTQPQAPVATPPAATPQVVASPGQTSSPQPNVSQPNLPPSSDQTAEPGVSTQPSQSATSTVVSQKDGYVEFSEKEAVKTGGRVGEFYFTGASTDGLVASLRKFQADKNVEKANADQEKKDLELAKVIVSAKAVKSEAGEIKSVELFVNENNEMVKYQLHLKKNGSRYDITQFESGNKGTKKVEAGYVKCLNTDTTCSQSVLRVKLDGAVATVILRKTVGHRFFLIQKNGRSVPLKVIRDYVYNTIGKVNTTKKIASMSVSTYEVVNGRSGMGVLLTMLDRESVAFNIPLMAAEEGTAVKDVKVSVVKSLAEHFELPEGPHSKYNIYSKIQSAELVNNNGLGEVKVKFDVSDNTSGLAQIWLTISRVQESLMKNEDVVQFVKQIGL